MAAIAGSACSICWNNNGIDTPHEENHQVNRLHKHCIPCMNQLNNCSLCRGSLDKKKIEELTFNNRVGEIETVLNGDNEDVPKLISLLQQEGQRQISPQQLSHLMLIAAGKGHVESVRLLLETGVDPTVFSTATEIVTKKYQATGANKYREIAILLESHNKEKLIRKRGDAICNAVSQKKPLTPAALEKVRNLLNEGGIYNQDLLKARNEAALNGQYECLRLLLDHNPMDPPGRATEIVQLQTTKAKNEEWHWQSQMKYSAALRRWKEIPSFLRRDSSRPKLELTDDYVQYQRVKTLLYDRISILEQRPN